VVAEEGAVVEVLRGVDGDLWAVEEVVVEACWVVGV